MADNLPALKDNYPNLQQAASEHLHYDKPSLFIHGKHSDYVNADDIQHIQTHFTQAKFVGLPTDHWVHAEQPQAFVDTVTTFLSAPA